MRDRKDDAFRDYDYTVEIHSSASCPRARIQKRIRTIKSLVCRPLSNSMSVFVHKTLSFLTGAGVAYLGYVYVSDKIVLAVCGMRVC